MDKRYAPLVAAIAGLILLAMIHAGRRVPVDVPVRRVQTTDYRIADCMIDGGIVLFSAEGQPLVCKGR